MKREFYDYERERRRECEDVLARLGWAVVRGLVLFAGLFAAAIVAAAAWIGGQ